MLEKQAWELYFHFLFSLLFMTIFSPIFICFLPFAFSIFCQATNTASLYIAHFDLKSTEICVSLSVSL